MSKKKILVGLAFGLVCTIALAQEEEGQVNPNSLLSIPRYEQLYKVKVWRSIDLRENQNKGFFARGNELSSLIIKAVKSGELADIYSNDSLTVKKKKEDFLGSLVMKAGATLPPWDPAASYYKDDPVTFNGKNYMATTDNKGKNPSTSANDWETSTAGRPTYYSERDIYTLKLVEDVIFDKRRSRLYYDMLAIEFSAFSTESDAGLLVSLGWFKYKDLEKLFRNHAKDAIWFNRMNTAENRNYADAFLLRLFHGTIDKVENPDNDRIFDTYNGRPYKEAVWATEWEEMKMMEKEHNLWEY